jgi:hypothetical protein
MKYLLIIACLFCFVGCFKRPLNKVVTVLETDSSSTKITDTYKDTTVIIPEVVVQKSTNIIKAIAAINNAKPSDSTVIVFEDVETKQHLTQRVLLDNKGNLNIECKADSLKKVITWLNTRLLEMFLQKNRTEKIEVQVPGPKVPTPYIPKWVYYVIGYAAIISLYVFRNPITKLIAKIW